MKAAVFTAPETIVLKEIDKPVLSKGEALIRVKACGICGSDIPFYAGIPDPYVSYPAVLGHEIAGEIAEICGDAGDLKVGDHVVNEITIGCGNCAACREGKYNCCTNIKIIGAHLQGGFAEYVKAPVKLCHKVPADMPFDLAAMCEPYSIGAQCARRVGLKAGDTVVINGAGTIGSTILEYAKASGARVLMADISDAKLDKAKSFGADEIVNVLKENLYDRVMRFTNNEGASVVVNATDVEAVASQMDSLAANGGRLLMVGIVQDKVKIDGVAAIKKELTIVASRNSTGVFPDVIDKVYTKQLHAREMISHYFDFKDIQKAFDFAHKNIKTIGKVMIMLG